MSEQRHTDELAWERSVNEQYLRKAEIKATLAGQVMQKVVGPANVGFAGDGPKKPIPVRIRPLVGRVALNPDDEELGRGFYVGGGFTPLDEGTIVVSWAAPAAGLFYKGRDASVRSPEGVDPRIVAARRTFKLQDEHIADFEDDCEPGMDSSSAFERPSPLAIPLPPAPSVSSGSSQHRASRATQIRPTGDRPVDRDRLPRDDEQPSDDSDGKGVVPQGAPVRDPSTEHAWVPEGTAVDAPTDAVASDLADSQPFRSQGGAGAAAPEASVPQMLAAEDPEDESDGKPRARRLLYEAIEAPKTGELASVLSTLQPEQYRLVTWPSEENLVVQGHPGTGKTIVAAHRAAYLVLPRDPDDESPRLRKVALVGPTDRWKRHIQRTVMGLVEEGVEVLSLEELVRTWAPRGSAQDLQPRNEGELQSRWDIGRVVDQAARAREWFFGQYKPAEQVRALVNSLVQDTEMHRRYVRSEDLNAWLLAAESYDRAKRNPSYLLFLAAASIAATGRVRHGGQEHIVVDEAQDIRPIEWWMLSRMFPAGVEARWSLFGDMNQRRSDFTWESWETLADRLELSSTDAQTLVPEALECGYRSTREILDYAGALLPRGMRAHSALRSGHEPSIRLVGPQQLADKAAERAVRLADRYHRGSVAVVAWDRGKAQQIEQTLLRRGWRREEGGGSRLRRPLRDCRLSILRPAEARGLEFDAVVVVEPSDFKPNLGRHGELYTSLTRANHELVVVHSKAMPRELKGRGSRVRG